jgi:hypothetical protein
MEPEETDVQEVLETPEPAEETVETPEEPELSPEEIAGLKAKAAEADTLREKNKQLYERAKKAEAKPAPSDTPGLSLADSHALLKADVHEDDIERVEKFAKSEGISIRDALKSDELKAILTVRAEKRSTANAANVSNVRRGPAKVTDETLIANANSGKLPDSDDDIARLVEAKARASKK